MQIGLLVLDEEGRIALFSAGAERILGHRARDVLGRPGEEVLESLTANADAREDARGRRDVSCRSCASMLLSIPVLAEGASIELAASARHRNGQLVPLAVTVHTMPAGHPAERNAAGPDGRPASAAGEPAAESGPSPGRAGSRGAILVFQDARECERMESQLQHLDRLRSLDEFAAGIVHEIRNPLAGISINAQHLAEEIEKRCRRSCPKAGRPDRFGEEMQDILADVESIEDIVKRVLDFAHPNKRQTSECAVKDVVGEALRFSRMPLGRRGIRLVTDLRASAMVRVDVCQMKQVLLNIVRNARDAMPGGGELRVRTARPSGNGRVRIEIEDTGKGIPTEYRERIFDPFFSMGREGLGLGLAISRRIVENHGGTIEVESEPDKGTRFAIVLPTV